METDDSRALRRMIHTEHDVIESVGRRTRDVFTLMAHRIDWCEWGQKAPGLVVGACIEAVLNKHETQVRDFRLPPVVEVDDALAELAHALRGKPGAGIEFIVEVKQVRSEAADGQVMLGEAVRTTALRAGLKPEAASPLREGERELRLMTQNGFADRPRTRRRFPWSRVVRGWVRVALPSFFLGGTHRDRQRSLFPHALSRATEARRD